MSEYLLNVGERSGTGRAANNKLKRDGLIPGIYYHKGEESIPISIKEKDVRALLSTPHTIIHLKIGAKSFQAVAKQVQYSTPNNRPIHVSFEGVKANEKLHTKVALKFIHEEACVWQKDGGVSQSLMSEVNVECFPQDLPDHIDVETSALKVGENIHISDLRMKGLTFLDDPTKAIVSIIMPRKVEEPEPDAAAPEAAPEPELVGKAGDKKAEEKTEQPAAGDDKGKEKKAS